MRRRQPWLTFAGAVTYPLYLIVYNYLDNARVSAPGVNQDTLLPIYTLTVKSF